MGKTQKQIDDDIRLTNKELRFLLSSMYSKYAGYVFKILRAKELGGYAPVFEECESAYKDLCAVLACEEIADQVLEKFVEYERRCKIRAGAKEDTKLQKAGLALRGWKKTPLMIEVEPEAAFTLWSRAGSWTGAMKLFGFEPLSGKRHKDAKRRYAINNASLDLLPEKYVSKMDDECAELLSSILLKTKRSGRWPYESTLQPHYKHFKSLKLNVSECLRAMGVNTGKISRKKPNSNAPVMLRNGQWMWPEHMRDKEKKDEYWRTKGGKK